MPTPPVEAKEMPTLAEFIAENLGDEEVVVRSATDYLVQLEAALVSPDGSTMHSVTGNLEDEELEKLLRLAWMKGKKNPELFQQLVFSMLLDARND